jgi:hypothetical protein
MPTFTHFSKKRCLTMLVRVKTELVSNRFQIETLKRIKYKIWQTCSLDTNKNSSSYFFPVSEVHSKLTPVIYTVEHRERLDI